MQTLRKRLSGKQLNFAPAESDPTLCPVRPLLPCNVAMWHAAGAAPSCIPAIRLGIVRARRTKAQTVECHRQNHSSLAREGAKDTDSAKVRVGREKRKVMGINGG